MESKKINQLATELAPELSDLTIIGDPTTGISKKITLSQMASLFTGTVEEYASLSAFPLVGAADTIYIALDTNIIYRWNTGTSAYVELSPNIVTSLVFNDANGFDGTISLVGSTATLTITTALTTGSVGFIGASGALLEDNANFFWNNSTKRLGINTNAPTTALDVFGSGIIGRVNGTSTNNAFIGFASAGSNKWSIGNVQSDHRFRIYNEATTSELVSVLQTGEFGIGIANPLTKLHIFGGASALIANLDANTSVAKSISYRSGNSSRINLEVSGTESGSNAGMDFFIRRYSDAGALIDTPLTITRSTGVATFSGTIIAGFSNGNIRIKGSTDGFLGAGASDGKLYLTDWATGTKGLSILLSTGAATFSSAVGIGATAGTNGLFEVSNLGTGVTVGDFLIDSANKNVYIGRLSSTSNDNTNFIVRNRVGTEAFKVTGNTGGISINGSIANSADTSLISIKQSSTSYTNGLYLERSGERNGYFMYIGGAVDSLTFRRNYFGTQSDVMSLTRDGDFAFNSTTSSGYGFYVKDKTSGFIFAGRAQGGTIWQADNNVNNSIVVYSVSQDGYSTAGTAIILGRNSSTARSINAGGTINASGADYAEYMTKAIEDNISKGDIVGVNAEGKLTNIFDDSISFVVKSTDPSYVGGDTWGCVDVLGKLPNNATDEEKTQYEEKLEEARAKVDRIAFSGQVPCNVLNANVGDYIIPIKQSNGKIAGQAVKNPTLEQYQISIGKVWKIMEDGRAWIAVKIG